MAIFARRLHGAAILQYVGLDPSILAGQAQQSSLHNITLMTHGAERP